MPMPPRNIAALPAQLLLLLYGSLALPSLLPTMSASPSPPHIMAMAMRPAGCSLQKASVQVMSTWGEGGGEGGRRATVLRGEHCHPMMGAGVASSQQGGACGGRGDARSQQLGPGRVQAAWAWALGRRAGCWARTTQ